MVDAAVVIPVREDHISDLDEAVVHELVERVVRDVVEVETTVGRQVVHSVGVELVRPREGRAAISVAAPVPLIATTRGVDVEVIAGVVDARHARGVHHAGDDRLADEVRAVAAVDDGIVVVEGVASGPVGRVVVRRGVVRSIVRVVDLVVVCEGDVRREQDGCEKAEAKVLVQFFSRQLQKQLHPGVIAGFSATKNCRKSSNYFNTAKY